MALLALLDVLRIRGGHAATWLATPPPPAAELVEVARIVTAKHRALHIALRAADVPGHRCSGRAPDDPHLNPPAHRPGEQSRR